MIDFRVSLNLRHFSGWQSSYIWTLSTLLVSFTFWLQSHAQAFEHLELASDLLQWVLFALKVIFVRRKKKIVCGNKIATATVEKWEKKKRDEKKPKKCEYLAKIITHENGW